MVQEDARKQVEAGAQILDVNAGIPGADEPALLRGAVQAVMEVVQVPLCFDSANPEALKGRSGGLPRQGTDQLHHGRRKHDGEMCCPWSSSTALQ